MLISFDVVAWPIWRCRGLEARKLSILLRTLHKANDRFILVGMEPINEAASLLGKRSAEVRQKKWGRQEFTKRMQEWGKLGGRPKGSGEKQPKKGGK